jgi:hypothetical protein
MEKTSEKVSSSIGEALANLGKETPSNDDINLVDIAKKLSTKKFGKK